MVELYINSDLVWIHNINIRFDSMENNLQKQKD